MNYNYYPPYNGFQMQHPFVQNGMYNNTSRIIPIYPNQQISREFGNYIQTQENDIHNKSMGRSKSVENLQSDKIVIGDHINLSKKTPSNLRKDEDGPKKLDVFEKNQEKPTERPPSNFFINNVNIISNNQFQSFAHPDSMNLRAQTFSEGFLVKKEKNYDNKEEDVLSDDSRKFSIRSPIPIKINQKELNEKIIFFQNKKQEYETLIVKNSNLKMEVKNVIEQKSKFKLIENLLMENKKLNKLFQTKILENLQILNNKNSFKKNHQNIEIKNLELKTKLKEAEIFLLKNSNLIKKIKDLNSKYSSIQEEIKIKEMTISIQNLTKIKNEDVKKHSHLMNFLLIQIEKMSISLKDEFQKYKKNNSLV